MLFSPINFRSRCLTLTLSIGSQGYLDITWSTCYSDIDFGKAWSGCQLGPDFKASRISSDLYQSYSANFIKHFDTKIPDDRKTLWKNAC